MATNQVSKLGFDLAYLALLANAGLKPLSRWEREFDRETEEGLEGLGLRTRVVRRTVQSGKPIRELVFSQSEGCLALYARRFDHKVVEHGPASARIEGLLFGYPSCCVESFVAKGYARNSLCGGDQRILFHWACPSCALTPLLLPHYRRVHQQCRAVIRGRPPAVVSVACRDGLAAHLKSAVALAASLVAMGNAPALSAPSLVGADAHLLPLEAWEDTDGDFLKSAEETILGRDPARPDENGNQMPDGVDLARVCFSAIDALPTVPSSVQPYVVHNMAFGLETCEVCGELVNMGFLEVVHPLENQSIAVPYVAKHCLEHGSFSYVGSVHAGRVNVPLLHTLLTSDGLKHFLAEPAGTDADADGLRDWEEEVFGADPKNRDTDGDQLIDGIDLARELRAQLNALPRVASTEAGPRDRVFVVEHPMDGVEICPRCGDRVVMDIWQVINPLTGEAIAISSMALHYLEHGGFGWKGGQLLGGEGRIDPRHLQAVLTGKGDGHLLHVTPDADRDLLADDEEAALRKDLQNPDEDANQVLDGSDLARSLAKEIASLPTGPVTKQAYRLDFQLKGLERCAICGETVNMGHLTVCNPLAHLYAKMPYVMLHYMEHGSFSFAGDVHGEGRAEVKLLVDAIHSTGPSHLLPVTGDRDSDGLADHEENHFGKDADRPDTDGDGVPDGFTVARELWRAVNSLPRSPNDACYAVEHLLRGVVTCTACGVQVNMGYVEVVNPGERLTVQVSYLALHYMEHGSCASSSESRVNPCLLDVALRGDGTSHLIALSGDTDHDGLLDAEEAHFGTRPDAADSDRDGVLDGIALARQMHERVKALPTGATGGQTYATPHEANCVAPCAVCGEMINCGYVDITNSWSDLSAKISYLNLHFMEHGSFAASATARVDPLLLDAILRPAVMIAAGENEVTLRWLGKAGRSYQVLTAPDVSGPWSAGPIFQGDGREVTVADGKPAQQARKFYKILAW